MESESKFHSFTAINKGLVVLCFTLFSWFIPFSTTAQEYTISLITCAPGEELYSTFGHSAIRVIEHESGSDLVFNYGTFDFNTPYFYIKFARRTLDYQLSVTSLENFLYEYEFFQRGVREQVLDLRPDEEKDIVAFLQKNYLPENRKYRYDFFFDNCSTRIREMMEEVLGSKLSWNFSNETEEQKTFRDLIDEYVYPLPWSDLGIDLALGAVIDRNASEKEKLFLPDYLKASFSNATIIGDGPERPLVKAERVIYEFPGRDAQWSILNPYLIGWLFAIFMGFVTFTGFKKKKNFLEIDIAFFIALGILGLVIVFLWFFTEHSQTKNNWNILWACPLHLYLAFLLAKGEGGPWPRKILLAAMILADLALVIWLFGLQSFHPSVLPILLVIILRTNFLYYNLDSFSRLRKSSPARKTIP